VGNVAARGAVVLAAGALLAGCDPSAPPAPLAHEWFAEVQGVGEWEHIAGESYVVFVEGSLGFNAAIGIAGDTVPGARRAWHVHDGTCEGGGGIIGSSEAYPPLIPQSDGRATATAGVPGALSPLNQYHVSVRHSHDALHQVIACGDLVGVG
jgi:hypothetical protein